MLINTLLSCVFFSRHQQLTKLLSRYINEPIHHKPRESHGKYYFVVSSSNEIKDDDYNDDNSDDNNSTVTFEVLCVCVEFFTHLCMFASCLNSFVLLDAVFSIPEWSCHPADSRHVGRLRGANLRFAVPLAGQKHLHAVPPHDHVPKV